MTSNELRQLYIDFFKERGHVHRPSASLVPDDPTVLFTVAGMVQFKPYFLGTVPKPYTRAVTSQKCVRTNDIENVGYTPRHHTFFEMLGNFSFGDYFKEDAIAWAWEFLTKVCGLEKEKLWVTVYRDDDEAHDIWKNKVGVPEKRIVRMGDKTNFWTMGDTGPCGPCTEILYDKGHTPGKPEAGPDEDEDRYMEIWNLVFTQFDRQADGRLEPLPQKNIDTGMGLERLAAVVQKVPSNFDTDLFQPLIQAIAKLTMTRYGKDSKADSSLRVIADHIRSAAFLIADGVLPGNEGRGYVLRRILRRAVRHGKLLGLNETFLYHLVPNVAEMMGQAYPELMERREHITSVVKNEEDRFQHTLDSGLAILNDMMAELKAAGKNTLTGAQTFQLYDTYGFPLDLTREIAQEHKLLLDEAGFNQAMEKQRQRARLAWVGSGDRELPPVVRSLGGTVAPTQFTGYHELKSEAQVMALIVAGQKVDHAAEGQDVLVLLDRTPCYAESGGQVADHGEILATNIKVEVHNVLKTPEGLFLHYGKVAHGALKTGTHVTVAVNEPERLATGRNHTATHLLHAALRHVLGKHVEQAGSEVRPDGFRFDFSHFESLTRRELDRIEEIVNIKILENLKLDVQELLIEEARARGAMALFGEKYGDVVRMVQIDEYSRELCGGTHVAATGEIGFLRILSESSVAAGVRRIEAVTGEGAWRVAKREQLLLQDLCDTLHAVEDDVPGRLEKLIIRVKELEKLNEKLQMKQASVNVDELASKARESKGVRWIAAELPGYTSAALRTAADALKEKMKSGLVVLGCVHEGKAALIVSVTPDLVQRKVHAGNLAKEIAKIMEGSGGGRPDFAQAGGKQPEKLAEALEKVESILAWMIN
jgi:alanyl-tRNA synthetase